MELNEIVKEIQSDTLKWFGEFNLTVNTLGLVGEAGEFADELKKVMRGDRSFEDALPFLREELVDLFIYVMSMAGALNMDLEGEYEQKRMYNDERFTK